MHQIISEALDEQMNEHSHGFHPNRSAHDALDSTRGYVKSGKTWVVDINLKSFFLDRKLERRGIVFVRYANDIALYLDSERFAKRELDSIIRWLRKHLDLEVNVDKSGVDPTETSQLLGFRIHESGEITTRHPDRESVDTC